MSSNGRRRAPRPAGLAVILAQAGAAAAAPALAAQDAPHVAARAGVTGVVIDAETGAPLEGAVVALAPAPGGLVAAAAGDGSGGLASARSTVTDARGAYAFTELPPGRYRLRVERLGYRAATFEAEVRRPVDARVSVGLRLSPVALAAVRVEDRASPLFRRASGGADEPAAARVALERARQEMFLTPDARVLSLADVHDGVTLGESDVFRALQRFPGVATRDDYTAELWTRGAPWAQTRVTFDGVPLFNPVHAVGVLSGIAPDILGAVFFHPGVRPAALADGAAGAVDLRSRAGGGDGRVHGVADVSMASAKATLERRAPDDGAAWIVSARRSYLDVLTSGLGWLGLDVDDVPYSFHDVAARLDLRLSERHALEASALLEEDRLFGDVAGVVARTYAHWGNATGRVTLHSPLGGLTTRHTLGFSRYRARSRDAGRDDARGGAATWAEPPSDNRIRYLQLSGEVEPEARGDGRPSPWSAGWELAWQNARYDGPEPRYHPVTPDTAGRLAGEGTLVTLAGWADARWQAGERWTASPGLRVEAGTPVRDAGPLRVSPRLALRFALTDAHTVSLAAGRTYQYLQGLALAGPSAHPAFHASQFWLWAGDDAPAVRADVVTLGSERWLGGGWLASATGFMRRATGMALPDPTPGPLVDRPLFVVGENTARGVELGVRRIAGRWQGGIAYTRGESWMDAAGLRFPAPADRRHRVDATFAARIGRTVRVGAAYTAMTGAPFTRVITRTADVDCELFGFACGQHGTWTQEPGAIRTPDYRSLDATMQWTRAFGALRLGAYVQVRNVLGRDNASTYSGSFPLIRTLPDGSRDVLWDDRLERGLPRMPLVGARIAF